jgi:hypothetical protein
MGIEFTGTELTEYFSDNLARACVMNDGIE